MIPALRAIYEKGFFHLLTAKFFTQFLGFGSIVVVARFLTPAELGELRILQSYTIVFSVIAAFGLGTSVLKKCSENIGYTYKEQILRFSFSRALVISVITYLFVAVLAKYGYLTSSPHVAQWLIIYALIIPFAAGTELFIAFLQALKKIKEMARAQAVIKLQAFLLIIICTYIWGFPGFIFASIGAYIVGIIPLLWQTGTSFLRAASIQAPAGFMAIAVYSMFSNGISTISKFADMFILDHFSPDRDAIGYYALATLFLFGAVQVTATVQQVWTPYLTERADEESWFRKQVHRIQLRTIFLSIGVSILVVLAAYVLVHLYYGTEYIPTVIYLSILILKYILWSAYAVMGIALLGLGLMKYNFIVVAITTPIGLLLSYLLLQSIGITGVAWAQVITAALGLIMTIYYYKKALLKHYSGK